VTIFGPEKRPEEKEGRVQEGRLEHLLNLLEGMRKTLLVILLLASSRARALPDCRALLSDPLFIAKAEQLYTPENAREMTSFLREKVQALMQVDPKLGRDSLQTLFHLYLEKRLARLEPRQRAVIWKVVEEGLTIKTIDSPHPLDLSTDNDIRPRIKATDLNDFTGMASDDNRVIMVIPEAMRETLMDYMIRIHELEHIIQHLTVGSGGGVLRVNLHYYQQHFFREKGAMRAEASFLMSFPEGVLWSTLRDYRLKGMEPVASHLSRRALRFAVEAKDSEDYIRRMWETDRYAPGYFEEMQLRAYQAYALYGAVFGGGGIAVLLRQLVF
jgi:hypothetical protein